MTSNREPPEQSFVKRKQHEECLEALLGRGAWEVEGFEPAHTQETLQNNAKQRY